ncbi:dipeptide ABC transporter dipeptide-binding protein [Nitratireductor aquibiodomus RA22]|uniref:Dipeptide ABC transporter dipeptide-binding protein n=1 Tax=Nitratireductor aquibiodomus RA22 TaxID=1189611 RepID=I5BUJ5_9HYPH|nr:ABC transporter permease [Nitratireductor aquibiodomus]EIM73247.1 dipeptide ABC transporter dipeptide-binding protein [Nitratireductor aquibiodomus RA22]
MTLETSKTDALNAPAPRRGLSDFQMRFLRSRNAMIGSIIVTLVAIVALLAPWITPHDPTKVSIMATWLPPGGDHLLGTDALGRDVLSRLIMGARVSLTVALSVLAITMTFGTLLGMVAAWYRGHVDNVLMRFVDIIFAFPELIIAIIVAAAMGPGTFTVIVALALVWWPGIARMARALVLSLREEPFVEAGIACGTPTRRIMWRHLLPNIVSPMIVRASLGVGMIIMAEATMSFLGIGVQEPYPTWGGMIRDGLPNLRTDPHLALSASVALGITMIGFNLLGDGLRDVLDPKSRGR